MIATVPVNLPGRDYEILIGPGVMDQTSEALVLPAGEATKNWEQLQVSTEWLLSQKVERGDVVIAFGGGVIGDLAGFAAAIMRRGVRFVQIPTTAGFSGGLW